MTQYMTSEYMTTKETGLVHGVTSHQVGRKLKTLGLLAEEEAEIDALIVRLQSLSQETDAVLAEVTGAFHKSGSVSGS